jgi:hypothetical protein
MEPRELPMNQTPARLNSSSFLYQEPTATVNRDAHRPVDGQDIRIRCVPPKEEASRKPVMARNMYRCQLCLISDWKKAMIAQAIWRDGKRYGALGGFSSLSIDSPWIRDVVLTSSPLFARSLEELVPRHTRRCLHC